MILIAIVLAAIGGGAAIAAAPSCRISKPQRARAEFATIEAAAELDMVSTEPGAPCPTVDTLLQRGVITASSALDPWRRPWVIDCTMGAPRARSTGPDGILGSTDDP